MTEIAGIRKKRGVVQASITRLTNRIDEVERMRDRDAALCHARRVSAKLSELDSEFRSLQFKLIDLTDAEDVDSMDKEQGIMNEHDDNIDNLTIRIQQLLVVLEANGPSSSTHRLLVRKLTRLEEALTAIGELLEAVTPADLEDRALIEQYQEELSDYKGQLTKLHDEISQLQLEVGDELLEAHSRIKKLLFDGCHEVKKLLKLQEASISSGSESKGLKIPKLEAPSFDGNILNWTHFWEQFTISIDKRSSLTDAEKFVYLQNSLKGGAAKSVIEGLSGSGENYSKAVKCLKARYDQPRLIHQSHVKVILEVHSLKDGNGKELRKFHDTLQQHLCALDAEECEPLSRFVTSIIQLKLDPGTAFEWQKHTQDAVEVPHYRELLQFVDLRARASESSDTKRNPKVDPPTSRKTVASHVTSSESSSNHCLVCKTEKHPIYHCQKFKDMSHDEKLSLVRGGNLCINCLKPGHFSRECKSSHRCRDCQKPHHSLLHADTRGNVSSSSSSTTVSSNTAIGMIPDTLLMTCQVLVKAPDGTKVKVCGLLDPASSTSFISERLAQNLCLPQSRHQITILGVAGLSNQSPLRSIAQFQVSPIRSPSESIAVAAIVIPRVTCDLPLHPVTYQPSWTHLSDLALADPEFGRPGRIDLLLGVDVYANVVLQGRRSGPQGSPVAFEMLFGWVLAGSIIESVTSSQLCVASHHISTTIGDDDVLRKFWEVEEPPPGEQHSLSLEERRVVDHFKGSHCQTEEGRFVVSLPKRSNVTPLGESRSQAVRRFMYLERSLHQRGQHEQFGSVMREYFDLNHAEPVPEEDLQKRESDVFYLPVHVVYKSSSTTTKVRAVFDASAKSTSGTSLNDHLSVGPTVHSPLIDVLLRFRFKKIAIVTDVSKMYRAIELVKSDRDLHRFIWRPSPSCTLKDYRMTRVTFGVSASSFIANMCVRQNAINLAHEFPLAAEAVEQSFYVDDGLTGADDLETAIKLQEELQGLFSRGGFMLHKWNLSDPAVLQHISPELRDRQEAHLISDTKESTKTLGIEWKTSTDQFHLAISQAPVHGSITKRMLISDIARIFNILGWFSPVVILVKILLQRFWEQKIDWDDPAPLDIQDVWQRWRFELPDLLKKPILRCYHPKDVVLASKQLHGFSDASEDAYAAVVYLRMVDTYGGIHISLVMSKTKVSPIKKLTIPRLELCGALLLAKLLDHTRVVFGMSLSDVKAWTDSTIVLSWLSGSPRRFKTFVGNRVATIVDLIPPERWSHVAGTENPADCASRGLYPSELIDHQLWWNGPMWLSAPSSEWPDQPSYSPDYVPAETKEEICHVTVTQSTKIMITCVIPLEHYSSFEKLKRVIAWIIRYANNSRPQRFERQTTCYLTLSELTSAERYLFSIVQMDHFSAEVNLIKKSEPLPKGNRLLPFSPFIDGSGILRVGGRQRHAKIPYSKMHPVILHGKHPVTKLLICSEHRRLLHAGPTLLISSLSRRYHIIQVRQVVRFTTRQCVICRRHSVRPSPQMMGQLPLERLSPGSVFDKTGLDYAGPFNIKYGYVRRPTIVKAYVCVFVSLTVKAVHLELVSDLTSEAFIACLRRFISRRGYPSMLWSDHGSNFVGAKREIKELLEFLNEQKTQKSISEFCFAEHIEWRFIPEHSPHFGGIWEAAVKSFKTHLKRVVSNVKLTFEEMCTVLTQIEACLNSRPLVPIDTPDEDSIEVLTPGHFLIGQPLTALPDPAFSYQSVSLLRRWHLCQQLVRHFWKRWSLEYLSTLQKSSKWQYPSRSLSVGDVVILKEDGIVPARWPLARVIKIFPGQDDVVRVADIKTSKGTYRRPAHKLALLMPCKQNNNI